MGIDPAKIYMVSVMPCTAKKFEAAREELSNNGLQDVDAVITTRELARMIKEAGIDFVNLPDESFDAMLGESTGAADIFGATGGVMEAALRTVADILEGKDLDNIEYTAVRGIEGVKEASVTIAGKEIKLAVANGTGNAKILMEKMKNGCETSWKKCRKKEQRQSSLPEAQKEVLLMTAQVIRSLGLFHAMLWIRWEPVTASLQAFYMVSYRENHYRKAWNREQKTAA